MSVLAWLLIPWTVMLATVDTRRWFPHPALKWAWVAFDALLVTGLFSLRARWRHRLALMLTFASGADAMLTTFECAFWNASRAVTFSARAILVVGIAAPTLAYLALWRATARRLGAEVAASSRSL